MNLELFFADLKKITTNKKVADFVTDCGFIFSDKQVFCDKLKIQDRKFSSIDSYNLMVLNGFIDKSLSSFDDAVEVKNLQENNCKTEIVNITKSLKKPLYINFVVVNEKKQNLLIIPNITINISDDVNVDIITSNLNINDGRYFENKSFYINIGKNCDINLYNFCDGKTASCMFENSHIKVGESSNLNIVSVTKGENILTKKTVFDIAKNSNISFNSSFCVINSGDISDDILLNHFENNASSKVNSYAVVFDKANMFFKTNVICPKNKENISTSQVSKILLGDDTATGKIEPYQTISTEKVSAFHGATISGISEAELFFLESRGINKITAENMIHNSYLQMPFQFIKNEKIKECFVNSCENLLPKS